eukprot:1155225-Pelagomonas_calceolata.AAC.1
MLAGVQAWCLYTESLLKAEGVPCGGTSANLCTSALSSILRVCAPSAMTGHSNIPFTKRIPSLWLFFWLAEASHKPISQTTWLEVTLNCKHCNHYEKLGPGHAMPWLREKKIRGMLPRKLSKDLKVHLSGLQKCYQAKWLADAAQVQSIPLAALGAAKAELVLRRKGEGKGKATQAAHTPKRCVKEGLTPAKLVLK